MSLSAFLLFIVLAFVTHRLSEMLVYDNAPRNASLRLRTWTGLYDTDEHGDAPFVNSNRFQRFVGEILDCPYCTGVWVSIPTALVWGVLAVILGCTQPLDALVLTPVVWLGLAGAQSVMEGIGWKGRNR